MKSAKVLEKSPLNAPQKPPHKKKKTKNKTKKKKQKKRKKETNKKTQRTPNYEQLCNSVIDGLQIHHFFCTYNTNYRWCITPFKIDLLKTL